MSDNPEKKARQFPHIYVVLFSIIILAALLTYVIPANVYDFALDKDGKATRLINPETYHSVPQSPVNPWAMMIAVPRGMAAAADVIFFLFLIGGSFNILNATGAVEKGVKSLALSMRGKEGALVFGLVALFSFAGASFGMAEEALVFIPMLVPLALALGFDSMTGLAIALAGPCAGFTVAFLNAFTEGVAQKVVGLPLFSGMTERIVMYVITASTAATFIFLYAKRVQKNPQSSLVYEIDQQRELMVIDEGVKLSTRDKLVLSTMVLAIAALIYGVTKFGWYFQELAAVFLTMGVVAGFIGGLSPNKIAKAFEEGTLTLTMGALIVGFARTVLVVLQDGSILHTIVHAMGTVVQGLPPALSAIGMLIVQTIISVVIPSGSGMAYVTMPIMGPLATLLGITQQTAVLVYQFADGFTNIIIPTSGYLLAACSLAKIPYEKWVKWYTPLFLIFFGLGIIFTLYAQFTKFGPF